MNEITPVFVGITLSQSMSKVVLVQDNGQIFDEGNLPVNLPAILEKLSPIKDQIAGVAVATKGRFNWLIDGLIGEKYRVYLSTREAAELFAGHGFIDGEWDAAWLAKNIAPGENSGDTFYLARYDSRLPVYLSEHLKTFRRVVMRSFGVIMTRQFDSAINFVADQNKLQFHIDEGHIKMRVHSLSAEHCRLLVDEAKVHAVRIVGDYKLINLIEETDYRYLLMNEQKADSPDSGILLEDGLKQLGLAGGI